MKRIVISIFIALIIFACSKSDNSKNQVQSDKKLNKTIEKQSVTLQEKEEISDSIQTDTQNENVVTLSKNTEKQEDTQSNIRSKIEKEMQKKPESPKQIKMEGQKKSLDSELYDFTLTSLSGEEFTLSEISGMVIMDFWATWCPPCRREIPYFQSFYDKYKDNGLTIIGISGDSPEKLSEFKEKMEQIGTKMTYPLLIDEDNKVAKQYNIRSIPTTYFIGKEGKVLSKHIGFRPDFVNEFEETIKEELGIDK